MSSRIPLTDLSHNLKPLLGDMTPGYRDLYRMVLAGALQLKRDEGNRRYYAEADSLPEIASTIRTRTKIRFQ